MSASPDAATFALIVPAYNEAARHIRSTCESLLQLNPAADEIIFVDDASTDGTRAILRDYLVQPSIQLIARDANRGLAAARNVGVTAATSEIVVFVDADNLLPPDFLARLRAHYRAGADAVAVEAAVASTDTVYERFFQAYHEHRYGGDRRLGFSQAFSCRRSLAIRAGLFPESLPFPGGEDGEFFRRLSACTDKRVIDRTIVVGHITPSTMHGFWRQWRGRGLTVPFVRHRLHEVAWPLLLLERSAATAWSAVQIATILPVLSRAVALARRGASRWSDTVPFAGLTIVQTVAERFGEWEGMLRLYRGGLSHAG